MSYSDSHLFLTISGPICALFIHYNTICRLFVHKKSFQDYSTISQRPFEEDLPSAGVTNTHILFIYSLFKTLKVYIIVLTASNL